MLSFQRASPYTNFDLDFLKTAAVFVVLRHCSGTCRISVGQNRGLDKSTVREVISVVITVLAGDRSIVEP